MLPGLASWILQAWQAGGQGMQDGGLDEDGLYSSTLDALERSADLWNSTPKTGT